MVDLKSRIIYNLGVQEAWVISNPNESNLIFRCDDMALVFSSEAEAAQLAESTMCKDEFLLVNVTENIPDGTLVNADGLMVKTIETQSEVGVWRCVDELREVKDCFKIEDYTIEYCPFCDSEQVIFSKGVTACPTCGKPLAPCSMCEECVDECPYGCDGTSNDEHKPITNRKITKEELELYKFL